MIEVKGKFAQEVCEGEYTEVEDQHIRASVVGHMIRLGHRPEIGREIRFSGRLREAEIDDSTGKIDLDGATNLTGKAWFQITICQADITAAHDLINSQRLTYGGKTSQILTDREGPDL